MGLAAATPGAAAACDERFTVLRTDTSTVAITCGKVDKERAGLLRDIFGEAQAVTTCATV